MKIFISEADRQSARRIALKNISRFYNVPDWESKDNGELLNDLSVLNDKSPIVIFNLLTEYFKAYDEWFSFYQKRNKTENEAEYNLTSSEQNELEKLINKRQKTLDALQKKFDELQLSKFNSQKFGNNISGTVNNQQA
jgi:hypothetical protein